MHLLPIIYVAESINIILGQQLVDRIDISFVFSTVLQVT